MRADRLLSIMMLLQARGRLTARLLGDELEVSERTIYRDIDALSAAGVPVYTERGPGGGCALLDHYRSNLTGLTEAELRALFILTIPSTLSDLGLGADMESALLKFSASLPLERRQQQAWVQQRIHLDWTWWHQAVEPVPFLHTLQQAIWDDRRIRLQYRMRMGPYTRDYERVVDAYGLVSKSGIWYLICATGNQKRVYQAPDLLDVEVLDSQFVREHDFNLPSFWQAWCEAFEVRQRRYPVIIRVEMRYEAYFRHKFRRHLKCDDASGSAADSTAWIELFLSFDSLEDARTLLLGYGGAVEVIEPEPLRCSIADHAAQVLKLYSVGPISQ